MDCLPNKFHPLVQTCFIAQPIRHISLSTLPPGEFVLGKGPPPALQLSYPVGVPKLVPFPNAQWNMEGSFYCMLT